MENETRREPADERATLPGAAPDLPPPRPETPAEQHNIHRAPARPSLYRILESAGPPV
jgi:hypothetical protein